MERRKKEKAAKKSFSVGSAMANFIDTVKAIITRLIFSAHGIVAIYRVVSLKDDPWFWYLAVTILLLAFEGIFTLTIKKTQEWKWFCPSVFLYLASVCPSIWLIELDKLDTRLEKKELMEARIAEPLATTTTELTTSSPFMNALVTTSIPFEADNDTSTGANGTKVNLGVLKDVGIPLDLENIPIPVDDDTLVVIIEQFLMLILIIGRWMLPKGDLTRDQLSQLLLVYIGTAADIIEFFDSFKDEKVNTNKVLCIMVLSIWSWSLLQFTFVLTATKGRKTRITQEENVKPKTLDKAKEICCSIDVWGILINIILQDAPFFVFRLLLIAYYRLISYMNIFFTCKNTLVITLQFYRLLVVQLEKKEALKKEEEAKKKKMILKQRKKQQEKVNNRKQPPNSRTTKKRDTSSRERSTSGREGASSRSSEQRQRQRQQTTSSERCPSRMTGGGPSSANNLKALERTKTLSTEDKSGSSSSVRPNL